MTNKVEKKSELKIDEKSIVNVSLQNDIDVSSEKNTFQPNLQTFVPPPAPIKVLKRMQEEKEKNLVKQKVDKIKGIFGKIFDFILFPILIFVVLFAGSLLFTKKVYGIPMFFGYTMVTVVSPSMVDAGFNVGSRAFIKKCSIDEYHIGDIIAFYDYVDPDVFAPNEVTSSISPQGNGRGSRIVFHRIADIIVDSNNERWYVTKGDNNAIRDSNPIYQNYVIGKNIPMSKSMENFINFVISVKGAVLIVVIPCAFVLFKDCLVLTDIYFEFKDEKDARKKFEEENPDEAKNKNQLKYKKLKKSEKDKK